MKYSSLLLASAPVLVASIANAEIVHVQITGVVEFNLSNPNNPNTNQDILGIQVGQTLSYGFDVDSNIYQDSGSFPVRGYDIIKNSFTITTSGGFSAGLADPFPGGATPYFVIRNNDPAVDGFYLTWGGVDFPGGLPMNEAGLFGDPFEAHFSVGYTQDTVDSLDILAAQGTYEYGNGGPGTLTNFYFNLVDLGFEVVGVNYEQMTIAVVPAPGGLALLAPLGMMLARHRRLI